MEKTIKIEEMIDDGHRILRPKPLIDCYRRVFSQAPWREWKKCNSCHLQWSRDEARNQGLTWVCPSCQGHLSWFWSPGAVAKEFQQLCAKDGCSAFLAVDGSCVIGLTIGYPATAQEIEEMLALSGIAKNLKQRFADRKLAYLDEIAVRKEFEGQGVARDLFIARFQRLRDQGAEVLVCRTNPNTRNFAWYTQKLAFEVIASYPSDDVNHRVVLAGSVDNVARHYKI